MWIGTPPGGARFQQRAETRVDANPVDDGVNRCRGRSHERHLPAEAFAGDPRGRAPLLFYAEPLRGRALLVEDRVDDVGT